MVLDMTDTTTTEYEMRRKNEAARPGGRVTALDRHVEAARARMQDGDDDDGSDDEVDSLPELAIDNKKKVGTVKELRNLFAAKGTYFEHGESPVHVVVPPGRDELPYALPMKSQTVVVEAETICRPVDTQGKPTTLPSGLATMYLQGFRGSWRLRPLAGISTAPILSDDGSIRATEGYDEVTQLWCSQVPTIDVSAYPSPAEAEAALKKLRHIFRSLPFADGKKVKEGRLLVIDQTEPPGHDESAFLVMFSTAIARPSLWLAPGYIINAPVVSGAGTGKGLLFRSICTVAYGWNPVAVTAGHDRQELDKRLSSELMRAQPAIFLDNMNAQTLRSNTLASAITERPSRCRIMGTSKTVRLNTTAFIGVTGNGLSIGEDLCRRFMNTEVDAGCENPELREFEPGFRESVLAARPELLAAALTIWRWGRQQHSLKVGLPLGGFEKWSRWCRDPLLTLGCQDPVKQIYRVKERDLGRMDIDALYEQWEKDHGSNWVLADKLTEAVKERLPGLNPPFTRQAIVAALGRIRGTRVGGRVLEIHDPDGKWSASKYRVRESDTTRS